MDEKAQRERDAVQDEKEMAEQSTFLTQGLGDSLPSNPTTDPSKLKPGTIGRIGKKRDASPSVRGQQSQRAQSSQSQTRFQQSQSQQSQ